MGEPPREEDDGGLKRIGKKRDDGRGDTRERDVRQVLVFRAREARMPAWLPSPSLAGRTNERTSTNGHPSHHAAAQSV